MSLTLSLLMPTRNRASYLAAGVAHFLAVNREDVELIVVDASDDHAEALAQLAPWLKDPRLQLIDNTTQNVGHVSNMAQNWAVALDKAQARWVTIIGDDDVLDPSVIDFIEKVESTVPNAGAITWHKAHFDLDLASPREAKIPMGTRVMVATGRESVIKQAAWPNPKRPPTALATPYHGAVRREVLNNVRNSCGDDSWFMFSTPDYDLGWRVAWLDVAFVISERPFSIAGVSSRSNSYSVRNGEHRKAAHAQWISEARAMDGWGVTPDPFFFSLPMVVMGFRNAFCSTFAVNVHISLNNFLETCRISLENQEDQLSFDQHKQGAVTFFTRHFGQDFGFGVLQRLPRPTTHFGGLAGEQLVVPHSVFNGDVKAFARVAFGVVRPVAHLFDATTVGDELT